MAGPTCEVLLASCDGSTLDVIDSLLSGAAHMVERTRKGRVWDLSISGRHLHWHESSGFEFGHLTRAQLAALFRLLEREYGGAETRPNLLGWLQLRSRAW